MQYKPEAVKAFEKLEEKFNATHDDIHLTIESPNDAMTVLKTRFIREDNPDIIGIGGDVNFSNFIDSDMLMDISDYQGLDSIKDAYKEIDKALEFVPEDEMCIRDSFMRSFFTGNAVIWFWSTWISVRQINPITQ